MDYLDIIVIVMAFIDPTIFLVFGIIFIWRADKYDDKCNDKYKYFKLCGYKTPSSIRNSDTWQFANMLVGILSLISCLPFFYYVISKTIYFVVEKPDIVPFDITIFNIITLLLILFIVLIVEISLRIKFGKIDD